MITLTGGDVILSAAEKEVVDRTITEGASRIDNQAKAIAELQAQVYALEDERAEVSRKLAKATDWGNTMEARWSEEYDQHTEVIGDLNNERDRGRNNVENALDFYIDRFIRLVRERTGIQFKWAGPEVVALMDLDDELQAALQALTNPSVEECIDCPDVDCPDRLFPDEPDAGPEELV